MNINDDLTDLLNQLSQHCPSKLMDRVNAALAASQPVEEPFHVNAVEPCGKILYVHPAGIKAGDVLYTASPEMKRMQIRNTDMGVELRKRAEAISKLTDELERTKATVDLEQFRDLAEFALQNAKLHNCWEKREALARELLALIDSHKQGK